MTAAARWSILHATMNQMTLFSARHWTVTEVTRQVRAALEKDENLRDVWVEGEVSNFSQPRSGHLYFTLKDESAALRCVMWRSNVSRLSMPLRDGMAVEAHGHISVYDAGGQYQLYVDDLRPLGAGSLYQEFLRLKDALEAEGLFDEARKRPLPQLPRRIGIVTSATGAALRDMLHTLRRRYPLAEVFLAPSLVQGEDAPAALVHALHRLAALTPPLDVILLARGGGSIEDLWAFNDEALVRAVAESPVPVISGVGHETDFTLADFAADVRAPTPTAAAELASPIPLEELRLYVAKSQERLDAAMRSRFDAWRVSLASLRDRLRVVSPIRRIERERQRVDDLLRRVEFSVRNRLNLVAAEAASLQKRLNALNPAAVLARGYAIVTREDGALLASAKDAAPGDSLSVQLHDGAFRARVEDSPSEEIV